MTGKAIHQNGLFISITPVDLTEGERVDLEIVRPSPQRPREIVSLQGIWRDHARSEGEGNWVSDAIAEIRRTSAEKLEQLARELSESQPHEEASHLQRPTDHP